MNNEVMPAGSVVLERFVRFIIDPAIALRFTAGFLLFLWGIVVFIYNLREGADYKPGLQHMIWGLVGMLIMMSVYGIIVLVSNTLGLDLGAATDVSRVNNIETRTNVFQ